MAFKLADIVVDFAANLKPLQNGLALAGASVKTFTNSAGKEVTVFSTRWKEATDGVVRDIKRQISSLKLSEAQHKAHARAVREAAAEAGKGLIGLSRDLKNIMGAAKGVGGGGLGGVAGLLGSLGNLAKAGTIATGLATSLAGVGVAIIGVVGGFKILVGVIGTVGRVASSVLGALGGLVKSVAGLVGGVLVAAFRTMGAVASGAFSLVKGAASAAMGAVKGVFSGLKAAGSLVVGAFEGVAKMIATSMTRIGGILENTGHALQRLATSMAIFGAAGVGAFISVVAPAAELEQAVTNATSAAGIMGEKFSEVRTGLQEVALELGENTVFSAREAASALEELALKGFDVTKLSAQNMVPILDLASASSTSLQTATELTASAMNVFGLSMEESARLAGVFAKAANSTAADVDFLKTSMAFIGPIAKSAGLSVEEVTAGLGFLSNRGIEASTAGTSLRQVIASLIDPTKEAQGVLKRLGVSQGELKFGTLGLAGVMKNLAEAGITVEDVFKIFPVRAASAAAALLGLEDGVEGVAGGMEKAGEGSEKSGRKMKGMSDSARDANKELAKLTKSLEGAGRSSEKTSFVHQVAETRVNTLKGAWEKLTSVVETVRIRIGEALTPALRKLMEHLTQVAGGVGNFVEKNRDFIANQASKFVEWIIKISTSIGDWVKKNKELVMNVITMAAKISLFSAAAAPLVLILSGMLTTFGSLLKTGGSLVGLFGDFGGALASPLTLLPLLGAALLGSEVSFKAVKDAVLGAVNGVRDFIAGFTGIEEIGTKADGVKSKWEGAGAVLRSIWEGLRAAFGQFVLGFQESEALMGMPSRFVTFWMEAGMVLGQAWGAMKMAWLSFTEGFSNPGDAIKDPDLVYAPLVSFGERIGTIWAGLKDTFSLFWEDIKFVWDTAMKFFKDDAKLSWPEIKEIINVALRGINSFMRDFLAQFGIDFEKIKRIAKEKFDAVKMFVDGLKDKFTIFLGHVAQFALNMGISVSSLPAFFASAKEAIRIELNEIIIAINNFIEKVVAKTVLLALRLTNPVNVLMGMLKGVVGLMQQAFSMGQGGAGMVPDIPQLQHGGMMRKSGLAMVGERGPELVSMPKGSRVHSASETKSMLGSAGQGSKVNINFTGPVNVRSESDMQKLGEKIAEEIDRKLFFTRRTELRKKGL